MMKFKTNLNQIKVLYENIKPNALVLSKVTELKYLEKINECLSFLEKLIDTDDYINISILINEVKKQKTVIGKVAYWATYSMTVFFNGPDEEFGGVRYLPDSSESVLNHIKNTNFKKIWKKGKIELRMDCPIFYEPDIVYVYNIKTKKSKYYRV